MILYDNQINIFFDKQLNELNNEFIITLLGSDAH